MSSVILPQEVIDHIVEDLVDSIPRNDITHNAILACTRVSKAFCFCARKLLFTDIRIIDGRSTLPHLRATLEGTLGLARKVESVVVNFTSSAVGSDNTRCILNLLAAEGKNLQVLGIGFNPGFDMDSDPRLLFRDLSRGFTKSLVALGKAPRLTTLILRNLSDIPLMTLTQIINLKTLIIEDCRFHHPVLAFNPDRHEHTFFDNLEDLRVIRSLDSFVSALLNGKMQLVIPPGNPQLGWHEHPRLSSLKSLSIVMANEADVQFLASVLKVLDGDKSLERLEIIMEDTRPSIKASLCERLNSEVLGELPSTCSYNLKFGSEAHT